MKQSHARAGRKPRALCKTCGAAVVLALATAWPAVASQQGTPAAQASREQSAAQSGQDLEDIAQQYLAARHETEKTQALRRLAEFAWSAPLVSQRLHGGISLPDALLQAMARDMTGEVPQARMNAMSRILTVLDARGRASMRGPLLDHLRQSQPEATRSFLRTALWAASRNAPEIIFQAIRETEDDRLLGDLAEIARDAALPDDVRRKLDVAQAASKSPDVRIQIAQTLGPGASGYDDIVRGVIAALDAAPSDAERQPIAVTLGKFPGPSNAITQAMIHTLSRTETPSRVMLRVLAETGPAGLLHLAQSVKREADAARLADKASMMAAVAVESGPLPADIAPAVIDAAIGARLRSDDSLLRSSVHALLSQSGQAAVAPIRQALTDAAPGQARDDLADVLARLEQP